MNGGQSGRPPGRKRWMNTASGSRPQRGYQLPLPRSRRPPLYLQLGNQAGEQLHPVAVFRIGGLLLSFDRLRFGLVDQEGCEEGLGLGGFAQGLRESPGSAGGVSIVVEVKVALRDAGKATEGIDGASGQRAGAAAIPSATCVSAGWS